MRSHFLHGSSDSRGRLWSHTDCPLIQPWPNLKCKVSQLSRWTGESCFNSAPLWEGEAWVAFLCVGRKLCSSSERGTAGWISRTLARQSISGLSLPLEGWGTSAPSGSPSFPTLVLVWWMMVNMSLVGYAMEQPVFPARIPRDVGTIPPLPWVPCRLEARPEPGLGLGTSRPASSRPVGRSHLPTPTPLGALAELAS